MADAESFDDFLARTAAAQLEGYADLSADGESVSAAAEFDKMKEYIRRYYEGVQPVHTFLDAAGNPVDCVPFEQQPSVRAARAAGLNIPPAPVRPASGNVSSGHRTPCPEGAVPLVRITLERLVRHRTLDDFFRKEPHFPSGERKPG